MSFDKLREEILKEAEKEADIIIKNAHKDAEDRRRKLELEMERSEDAASEEVKAITEMMENREIASASLEAKKKQLLAKKQVMGEVFTDVRALLSKSLSRKQREELIARLLKNAESQIEIGKIYCNKTDAELIPRYKTEHKEMLGGLIAQDKSGTVQVDYSFESILEDIQEKHMAEIHKILFG